MSYRHSAVAGHSTPNIVNKGEDYTHLVAQLTNQEAPIGHVTRGSDVIGRENATLSWFLIIVTL